MTAHELAKRLLDIPKRCKDWLCEPVDIRDAFVQGLSMSFILLGAFSLCGLLYWSYKTFF